MKREKSIASTGQRAQDDDNEDNEEGVASKKEARLTCGENVECGQGHGFCWCAFVLFIGKLL